MKNTNKKVLIISHNPLSQVNNNGKTLVSIFDGVQKENIYQIYLNADTPDYSDKCNYLQINEKQILKSILQRKNLCCQEIKATPGKVSSATIKNRNFANHTKRLLRECVWKFTFWKPKLNDWLKDKSFDVVFFMAGDGLFAYNVYRFILNHISAKGCLFFTDDYIIGKTSYSPAALLRQSLLKQKIKKTLEITKELYVISDEMKDAYYKLYKKEGYVIRNFSIEKKMQNVNPKTIKTSSCLEMVYAGGLHYNRWKVLSQIAKALETINGSGGIKCKLKIYSAQKITEEIIQSISIEESSEFCGGAAASEIADIYANADILLHVESFDKKAIASTKYSFSTKIPEYLSAGKCVLAVGPSEVASIRYLSEVACVVYDAEGLLENLSSLINDAELRESVKHSCRKKYEDDFSPEKQRESLSHILSVS